MAGSGQGFGLHLCPLASICRLSPAAKEPQWKLPEKPSINGVYELFPREAAGSAREFGYHLEGLCLRHEPFLSAAQKIPSKVTQNTINEWGADLVKWPEVDPGRRIA